MRAVRALLLAVATFAAALLAFAATTAGAENAAPRVLAIEFDNDVNPVKASYVIDELERAERERYDAAVILLDTPGGLAEAMRDIYQKDLALKIPVIAPSLGGVESLIEQPLVMSYYQCTPEDRRRFGIPDNMIRMSCGIENPEDLISDLAQALDSTARTA